MLQLNEAMKIAMISFTFPIQMLMAYIFARKTNRNFPIRFIYMLDTTVFLCILWWFEKYFEY